MSDDRGGTRLLANRTSANNGAFSAHAKWNSFGGGEGRAVQLPRRHLLRLAAASAALPDMITSATIKSH
jgi:hypothetical protein